MGYCIVHIKNKKIFGKVIKYSKIKQSYLVEFRKSKTKQWISENLVTTKYNKN